MLATDFAPIAVEHELDEAIQSHSLHIRSNHLYPCQTCFVRDQRVIDGRDRQDRHNTDDSYQMTLYCITLLIDNSNSKRPFSCSAVIDNSIQRSLLMYLTAMF